MDSKIWYTFKWKESNDINWYIEGEYDSINKAKVARARLYKKMKEYKNKIECKIEKETVYYDKDGFNINLSKAEKMRMLY